MDSSSLFLSAVGSKLSMTFNGHRVAANQISLSSLANRSAAPCLQCPLNTPLVSFHLYLEAIFAAWTKLSCEQDTLDQAGEPGPVEPGFSRQRVVLPTSHVEQSAWWCVCTCTWAASHHYLLSKGHHGCPPTITSWPSVEVIRQGNVTQDYLQENLLWFLIQTINNA